MAKKGKLYGIGVGPGDTELLTLKAARILKTVPVIFTPKSSKEKDSIALSIVKPILKERNDYTNKLLAVSNNTIVFDLFNEEKNKTE